MVRTAHPTFIKPSECLDLACWFMVRMAHPTLEPRGAPLLHYLNALISTASLAAIITITVLRRTATHFICRVLFLVQFDLGVDGLFHIDAKFIGEANKVDLDVGNFLFYFGEFFGWQGLALFFCQPLEVLNQFGGLDDQCHGEVLRGVELVPVALFGEFTQAGFYLFE